MISSLKDLNWHICRFQRNKSAGISSYNLANHEEDGTPARATNDDIDVETVPQQDAEEEHHFVMTDQRSSILTFLQSLYLSEEDNLFDVNIVSSSGNYYKVLGKFRSFKKLAPWAPIGPMGAHFGRPWCQLLKSTFLNFWWWTQTQWQCRRPWEVLRYTGHHLQTPATCPQPSHGHHLSPEARVLRSKILTVLLLKLLVFYLNVKASACHQISPPTPATCPQLPPGHNLSPETRVLWSKILTVYISNIFSP